MRLSWAASCRLPARWLTWPSLAWPCANWHRIRTATQPADFASCFLERNIRVRLTWPPGQPRPLPRLLNAGSGRSRAPPGSGLWCARHGPAAHLDSTSGAQIGMAFDLQTETIGPATLRSLRRATRPVVHGTTRVVPHQATAEPAAGSRVPYARTHNRGTAPDPVLCGDPLAIVECYDLECLTLAS